MGGTLTAQLGEARGPGQYFHAYKSVQNITGLGKIWKGPRRKVRKLTRLGSSRPVTRSRELCMKAESWRTVGLWETHKPRGG